MKNPILAVGAVVAALSGCASTEVKKEIQAEYTTTVDQLNDATNKLKSQAPIILPTLQVPYLGRTSVLALSENDLPEALRSKKAKRFNTAFAYDARAFGKLISEETGLPVDVQNPPTQNGAILGVDLSMYPAMTLKELLDVVSPQLGLDWLWDEPVLRLSTSFTRVYEFDKSSSSSKGKMLLAKASQSQVGTNGGNSGTSGNFESELKGEVTNDADQWLDASGTLKAIAGEKNVIANKSLSLFTVTCSKACHKEVKQFIDQANAIVTRQVHLSVLEVSVATTKTGQSGVKWNVFYEKLGLGKQFFLNTPQSLVNQATAGGVGLKIIDTLVNGQPNPNNYSGSEAIFQALSASSTIVDTKPYDLMALNNESTTLGNTDQQSYVQATTVVPTGTSGAPVFSQTPGYATFGQFIQVIPTVLSGGRVIIRFGIDDTKLKQITPGVNQGDIDRILLGALNFNNQAIVRSGQTLVLSGFKRRSHKLQEQGLVQGQKIGSEAGDTELTETVIMITPTVTGS